MRAIRQILNTHENVAMLIGNGPNLVSNIMPTWKQLLKSVSSPPINFDVDGLSNTEVYDLVELHSNENHDVKQQVITQLELLPELDVSLHRGLMSLARDYDSPVLTTNFDEAFEKSIDAKLFRIGKTGFTRFYPWESYYGFEKHELPTNGFGIWKVHGDVRYKDSIRLGLTDYMGSVERARRLIHRGEDRLFKGKRQPYWKGHQSWLHIWFNMPIVIFGLGFDINEVFLRWLLIERRRYLNLYQDPMEIYYISTNNLSSSVRNLMQNLGVEIITINDYSELYG